MFWADREGSFCPSTGCSVESSGTEEVSFTTLANIQGFTAERYMFNATINTTTSISKFWFEINNSGSDPITVDNGGGGFVIDQDSLFLDMRRSQTIIGSFPEFLRLVVAVCNSIYLYFPPKFTPTGTWRRNIDRIHDYI